MSWTGTWLLGHQHIVASELKDPIWHSSEWQIGSFSSEATTWLSTSKPSIIPSTSLPSFRKHRGKLPHQLCNISCGIIDDMIWCILDVGLIGVKIHYTNEKKLYIYIYNLLFVLPNLIGFRVFPHFEWYNFLYVGVVEETKDNYKCSCTPPRNSPLIPVSLLSWIKLSTLSWNVFIPLSSPMR